MLDLNKKCFANKYCQECIAKNIAKYGEFKIECEGIKVEENVAYAIKRGMSEEDARWMYDTVYFFEKVYGSKPRWYQEPILLCTSKNLCCRQCRQSGKTLAIMMKIMHFVVTEDKVTVLVVGPNEKVIKKIYDEYILRDCVNKSIELKESVASRTQKPYYEIKFCNESKVVLMIAGDGARSQTANWLYVDEAAMIPSDVLNSIVMTTGSIGDEATVIETSTPRGRGNIFYKACKEDVAFNEFHVPISVIGEMKPQIPKFRRLLGETGFMQECEAEFPEVAGGPFNFHGIDLSKKDYKYEQCFRKDGIIYIGGVDWNGPAIGSYFYVIGFDPNSYTVTVVDKIVVASSTWNSIAAKQTLIDLNRKWNCKHWMVDQGYGHAIIEELKAYSIRVGKNLGNAHPDSQIKYILEGIEFGAIMKVSDPFTREETSKTTKSFVIQQAARLFEPHNEQVAISLPLEDQDLIKHLEAYILLNITVRGYEQYGFIKGEGLEDHILDALFLAVYGIVKYYNELFKRVVYSSVTLGTNTTFYNATVENQVTKTVGRDILLISCSDTTPIHLEESKVRMPAEDNGNASVISRSFARGGTSTRGNNFMSTYKNRGGVIRRTGI